MLIQCDYQTGDFSLSKGKIYYKGNEIATTNLSPIMTAGTDELYLFAGGKFPLKCAWLVIFQSRYPVFYMCKRVYMDGNAITLYLEDDRVLRVKPYLNGIQDRILIDPTYAV